MTTGKFAIVFCLGFSVNACSKTRPVEPQKPEAATSSSPATEKPKPLAEIDISEIGQIAPKGRVQDKDYNNLAVVDQLLENGKDSIPFLISKLDDGTVIHHHVFDYWPGDITVGDVAFVILGDFTTDSTWTKKMIPGTSSDDILGKSDPNIPGVESLTRFVDKHGRKPIQGKWEKIWLTYKDRIVWDQRERCFKVV